MNIHYTDRIEAIDWVALKAELAADAFDNGRTPAQLQRHAKNSAINIFACDGARPNRHGACALGRRLQRLRRQRLDSRAATGVAASAGA